MTNMLFESANMYILNTKILFANRYNICKYIIGKGTIALFSFARILGKSLKVFIICVPEDITQEMLGTTVCAEIHCSL